MTPARRAAETANKRAERQRRKEAGEVRVETWFAAEDYAWLKDSADKSGWSISQALTDAVSFLRREEL